MREPRALHKKSPYRAIKTVDIFSHITQTAVAHMPAVRCKRFFSFLLNFVPYESAKKSYLIVR